jgi:eukaryotic-like serine/threonine-protein kinase
MRPTSASGTVQDRIARHQHAVEILRARGVIAIACALWLACGFGLDLTLHGTIGSGSLWFVVVVRLATSAWHAFVLAMLYKDPMPHPRVTNPLVISIFPVSSIGLTLIATHMGGIASPYVTGTFVIIMVEALATPGPWQRGALLSGLTCAIWPAGLLLAALVDPQIAAQLDDPAAVAVFITHVAVLAAGAIVVSWGGHIVWTLRRSVFESRSIGRYRLIRRIGKGGMGEVWRAHDKALRRDVALKILSPEHGRNPSAIARFEREIQATAELDHPHIVRIHDWGVTDDGVWFYAMDLLEGVDLSTLVKRNGALPPALVVHLGTQAASALAEAHARGVVHRDVKPANLFVVAPQPGELEKVKLLDFGVARLDNDEGLTNAGAVVGTPGFIAPEVFAGGSASVASDCYGLAATLYYALTGKTPRDTGTLPPSEIEDDIPAELDDAIVRALDADPTRRHRGCDELGIELGASGLADAWTGGFAPTSRPPHLMDDALGATVDAAEPATRGEIPIRARN